MFFFSSRGRHTRSLCDWSSDVCSSDLSLHHSRGTERVVKRGVCSRRGWLAVALVVGATWALVPRPAAAESVADYRARVRSEERRVGKEGRYRGQAYHWTANERYNDWF